jgi:arsenate reductase
MVDKLNVLFLCTGNACRSQMAEGLCRHFKSDAINAYSAGIETHGLNQLAVMAMSEIGIDISEHRSKVCSELKVDFDYVITVCGHANETCPVFSGECKVIHVGFDDPPQLAKNAENEAQALPYYRRVRDEIAVFIQQLPDILRELP